MNDAFLNYQQRFFIDGLEISGVQSIGGGYYINESPVNILGFGNIGVGFFGPTDADPPKEMAALVSPIEGRFSIEGTLVSRDIFMDYTGGIPLSGSINYAGGTSFGFASGYISDHGVSCSVGSLPRTQTNLYAFGDVGSGIDAETVNKTFSPHPEIQLTNQENIEVQCRGTGTNRVTRASYRISSDLDPIYVIGSPFAQQVDIVWPMVGEMSFQLEVDDFEYKAMRDYFVKPSLNTVSLTINDCSKNEIQSYQLTSGRLISESITSQVDGVLAVDLTYRTYYNKR